MEQTCSSRATAEEQEVSSQAEGANTFGKNLKGRVTGPEPGQIQQEALAISNG